MGRGNTDVESEEASEQELCIGADDTVKVWLNGEVVHTVATEIFLNNRRKPCSPVIMGATHNLKRNTNIIVVQEALGHKRSITTQKYTHFLREMMDEQLTKNTL